MTTWNDDRLDELSHRVEQCATKTEMNLRFDLVDQQLSAVNDRLDGLDGQLSGLGNRIDELGKGLGNRIDELGKGLGNRIDELNNRFDQLLHTLVVISWGFAGTVLAAAIGLIAVVLL